MKQWQLGIIEHELLKCQTKVPFPWGQGQEGGPDCQGSYTYPESWGEALFSLPQFLSVEEKLIRKDYFIITIYFKAQIKSSCWCNGNGICVYRDRVSTMVYWYIAVLYTHSEMQPVQLAVEYMPSHLLHMAYIPSHPTHSPNDAFLPFPSCFSLLIKSPFTSISSVPSSPFPTILGHFSLLHLPWKLGNSSMCSVVS